MDSSGETDTSMSDTERAKLAKELDDDLDRFIDDLIKQVLLLLLVDLFSKCFPNIRIDLCFYCICPQTELSNLNFLTI